LFFKRLPWIDQTLVKGQLLEIEKWMPPPSALKPFIISSLTEECYIYIYLSLTKPLTTSNYTALILAGFKEHAASVLLNYPPQLSPNDQRNITSTLATRWLFACSSRHFLEKAIALNGSNSYYQTVFDFPLDFPGK
jgi:hypothetical protein